MDHSVKFWDRIAEKYAKQPIADQDSYEKKLQVTQSYLNSSMEVLEFGCGTGSTALIHAPRVARYRAIDIAPKMIEIANSKRANENVNNLEFAVATLEDEVEQSAGYDAILGLNILHLLRSRDQAIQQVYKLLKPGGVFVSNTACLGSSVNIYRYIVPIGRLLRIFPLVKVFNREALEQSLTAAGFEIEYRWVPENNKLVYFMVAKKPGV